MPRDNAKIAMFWDESFLWGLICYRTFRELGLDFELLQAKDVAAGGLASRFDLLFVPGGWARDKMAALGEEGSEAIREFVRRGGGYLGFCGGAGLALSHESGLGLAPFGRLPTSERLPSFSGRITLVPEAAAHPMWRGLEPGSAFCAWWPGQFDLGGESGVTVLASYGKPAAGSFVTDLPCGMGLDWPSWEKAYGINLDPERIVGAPAVAEIGFGQGKAILSYLHFETPDDAVGHHVLVNLIEYVSGKPVVVDEAGGPAAAVALVGGVLAGDVDLAPRFSELSAAARISGELESSGRDFIDFGAANFMWYRRSDWLLQWRRGVRGIEYSTLMGMLAEIDRLVGRLAGGGVKGGGTDAGGGADAFVDQELFQRLSDLQPGIDEFFSLARDLVLKERFAMNAGPVSPLKSSDPEISKLRERLFSTSRRCGGLYREILKQADGVLLPLLRRELESER